MSKQADKRAKGWRRCFSSQRGIETVEWIAIAAVILALLAGMLTLATPMGRGVATSMFGKMSVWIARWSGEGGSVQPGQSDTDIFGPEEPSLTSPAIGIPELLAKIFSVGEMSDDKEHASDSTSTKSVDDILAKLKETERGKEIAAWLEEHDYKIVFEDLSDAYGEYRGGDTIYLNSKYRDLPLESLAATVAHEGQHAIQNEELIGVRESFFISRVPIAGWFFDLGFDFARAIDYRFFDPAFEEYSSFRVQAEVLKEFQEQGYTPNRKDQNRIDLIFTPDGSYRDVDVVKKEINKWYLKR